MPGFDDLLAVTWFVLVVAVAATVLTCLLALAYLRHVRLERPAIGVFNRRDIIVLFAFVVGLPLLYLALPITPLIFALGITFASALSIGLRPLLGAGRTWIAIGVLIGLNIWMTRTMLGTVWGWQLFWLENNIIVILAAISIANLYVQGGMSLKHVAWFAIALAVYDAVFQFVWPVTTMLAQRFLGWPLDPAVGFRWGVNNASIGLGDLLVYSVFVIAVYKGYGPARARMALLLAVVFGAVIPALAPLMFNIFADARTDLFVPAQVAFGPIAFWYYRRLQRTHGRERTMAEFLAGTAVPARRSTTAEPPRTLGAVAAAEANA
jgi:hypothetical protein